MTPDPDLTGPPEYQPDEDPGDDDATLFAGAAYELAGREFIEEQRTAGDHAAAWEWGDSPAGWWDHWEREHDG